MTQLVLDASVAVKWFLPDAPDEPDSPVACDLLVGVQKGRLTLRQPTHWRAEIAAVLACRLSPALASDSVEDLGAIVGITVDDSPSVLRLAIELSAELNHHLFDTLYHALAMEAGVPLVTADTRYHRKAAQLGRMVLLSEL